MAAYLICVTSGSGIPVFTRSVGNVKPLPFPVIGSLNAVHMFAANHDAVLKSTTTDDAQIIWKEFENSLVLILVHGRDAAAEGEGVGGGSGSTDDVTGQLPLPGERLLQLAWEAMILLYGKEDLLNIRNVERFKKEIKVCYQLVDTLLLQAASTLFSDVTGAVDVVMVSEASVLQNFMEAFAEASESPYGCLLIGERIVAATDRWWGLSPGELTLLSTLLVSLSESSARDIPVYLPHGSPTVPHRLMTFELLRNVTVCVICGPSPPLSDLEKEVARFWVPAAETLKTVRKTIPRNIPVSLEVDLNILGFLLINTSNHRCLNSVSLAGHRDEPARQEKRRAVLRSFYSMVIGSYFTTRSTEAGQDAGSGELLHKPTDTYIVCSGHKCYAHTSGKYQIFVLFAAKTPTFAMRSVTQKTLNQLVKDKNSPL